jgi:hypothetical protein
MSRGLTVGFSQVPLTLQAAKGLITVAGPDLRISGTGTGIVALPTFVPVAGTYIGTQTITISSTTPSAAIYYTTDGTSPTFPVTGTTVLYTGPFTASSSETVKAIGVVTGLITSGIASAAYVIQIPAATPTFLPIAGTYGSTQFVALSCSTPSSSIYYTVDGSTPTFPITGTTALYTGSISVVSSQTIKAIGTASGFVNSAVGSAAYVISAGAGSFFGDPFAGFSNVIADTTFGGTAGATTTVGWNGGTISGPTYSTTQAAIAALLAAGPGGSGRRVCRLLGQSESVASTIINIPGSTVAAGFTSSLPFVIQGDPIATQAQLPKLDGGGTARTAIMIGGQINEGGTNIGGFNNTNVVIRKNEITNCATANGASGIHVSGVGGSAAFNGLIVEFNYIHLFRGSGSDGETGPIYCDTINSTENATVRFNKLADVQLPAGGINQNHSCVGLYGGIWQIFNNEMFTCTNGVRFKNCAPTIPNGSQVYNNSIHDVNTAWSPASGGEGPAVNQIPIFNNLFGWQNLNNAVFQSGSAVVNDFGAGGGTTTPLKTMFFNNTVTQGWGSGGGGGFLNDVTQQCSFFNNIMLCPTPVTCSENGSAGSITFLDFNAYFVGNWIQNNEGTPQHTYTTFAAWQVAFTTNAYHDLTANPDAHGLFIPNLSSPFNTIAGNFPNSASNDYTLAVGSPMIGAGQSGVNMGCNMSTVGPGW